MLKKSQINEYCDTTYSKEVVKLEEFYATIHAQGPRHSSPESVGQHLAHIELRGGWCHRPEYWDKGDELQGFCYGEQIQTAYT
jgi:hypothetical protein